MPCRVMFSAWIARMTRRLRQLNTLECRKLFFFRAIHAENITRQGILHASRDLQTMDLAIGELLSPRHLDNSNTPLVQTALTLCKTKVADLRELWDYPEQKPNLTPLEERELRKLESATYANRAYKDYCQCLFRIIEADLAQEFIIMHTLTVADHNLWIWDDPTPIFRITPNTPNTCLLYTSPSPRDRQKSRMPSSA